MGRFLDHLIHWSIEHRAVVLLASVALLVAGVWSASHAPLDVLPDFMPPRVVVQTEAPGMAAADVEQLVTVPLEQALLGTPYTTSVRSTSTPGLSVVTLLFADDVEPYRARLFVTERIDLTRGRLPATVQPPRLAPLVAPLGAILKFCLTSSDADASRAAREMRAFADWKMRPRLLAVAGVAQVTALGGDVERIEVQPDAARMRARGVALDALGLAVSQSQTVAAGGFVESANARIDVANEARLTLEDAPEVLADSPVATERATIVRIGDVATVARADEPRLGATLYDGKPAIYIQITKSPAADTMAVTRDVERALVELGTLGPQGMRIEPPVFRQASFVLTSVWSVGRSMAIGSVLVVVVLVAFLRSGRLAAISLTAIPMSIVTAVLVLVAMGATINGMTLGGLAIAVGEVVDDAIVDVENVWRRLRENAAKGSPVAPLEVIREASREVRGSVVYATIIVVMVLLPVLFLGGIAGRIFAPLAQAYILAIAASLFVALTVTPAMCAWLLPALATRDARPSRLADALLARYAKLLRRVSTRPRIVVGAAAILALAALCVLPFLGGRFLPEFHENSLIAHVYAVPGTSLDETMRLGSRIDAQLRPSPGVHMAARAGRSELDEDAAPVNRLELDVVLDPKDKREWEEIGGDASARLDRVAGLAFSVEGFLGERVHEVLSGETSPVVLKVTGPDLAQLRAVVNRVTREIGETGEFSSVRVEPQIDVPQLRIRPNRIALARWGVSSSALADAVTAWRQGQASTQILGAGGRITEVVIAGPPSLRDRVAIADIPVLTRSGATMPLSALGTVDEIAAPAAIQHDGGERRIAIGLNVQGAGLSGAVAGLERRLTSELKLPSGYRVEVGGEAVARRQAGLRLAVLGALVLLGIFAVLATAFSSLTDAGIVLLNFPLGLVGGVAGALLTPEGLSVAGFVGFVTLFGIIARNGIMLVSHKRHLEQELPDLDPVDRVHRAAEERLLPILMTAATAGLGLLPLALSFASAGSELEAPMAMIVIGGLISSTTLNLLVLPTIYVWLERRRGAQTASPG
jgi:CzcA family heavy metal efflux pump